jgi:hypothetical protein
MASGTLLGQWTPAANQPPATAFATFDTRNSVLVLDFDAATDESAIFAGKLRGYDGGGITVNVHWMASTATSGDVIWAGAFERGNTDLDADSFDTAQTATGTANATSGIETVTAITFTNSQIDGLLNSERFRFRLTRDADAGGDTMTGDAEVILVEAVEA